MSIPVGQAIDMTGNQIENVRAQNLASDPGTPGLGQFWYNTASSTLKFYDGLIRTVAHLGTRLDQFAAPTASLAMNAQRITGLADPVNGTDATTKQYVDAAIQGMKWKQPARVATVGTNITLAGGAPNTLDGKSLVANDRVLVKDQTTGAQNGIYYVSTLGTGSNGTWVRALDMDSTNPIEEIVGAAVFVSEGTINGNSSWVMTTDAPITLGTTALVWSQFGGGQAYTGTSLGASGEPVFVQVSGTQFQFNKIGVSNTAGTGLSISTASNVITINFNPANVNLTALGSYLTAAKGGTGQTTYTIGDMLYADTASTLAKLTMAAVGNVLLSGGAGVMPSWGKVALGTHVSGTLPIANGGTGGTTAAAARTALGATGKVAQDLSTSATSYAITHNLGTLDVHVSVFEKGTPFREVMVEVQHTDVNTVTLIFGTAPTANAYRVVVIG